MQKTLSWKYSLLLAGLLSVFIACQKKDTGYDHNIIAKINDSKITFQDFSDYFKQKYPKKNLINASDSLKNNLRNDMILQQILLMEAYRLKYNKDVEIVKFVDEKERELAATAMLKQITTPKRVTEAELKRYYQWLGKSFTFYSIMVKTGFFDENRKSAEQKANDLYKKILNGKDFKEIAFKYSEKPGAKSDSGRMANMECFDIYEGLTKQLYQMKEGETSKPFYTDNAYYIIKLEKIYEWKIADYEQEKPQLIESLNKFFDDCVTFKTNEFNNFIKRANHYQTFADNIDFFCKRTKNMTFRADTLGLFTDKEKALPLSKNDVEEITIGVFLPKVIEFYWDSLIHESVVVMLLDYMNTKRLIKHKAIELKFNGLPEQKRDLEIWKTHYLKEQVIQKEILDHAKVSDDVLRSIYMKNKAKYKVKKRITVREIFCKSQTQAEKVYQLAINGENFEQLEKQYNQNQETRTHGLLGPFEKGRNGILGETAFDGMPVGSISKPFRYRGGYSLFQIISIDAARYKSFQEVKDELKSQFIDDYKNDFIAKWFQKVKKEYKIKLYEFS